MAQRFHSRHFNGTFAALACALLMVACGGGGGDDRHDGNGNTGPGNPPRPVVKVFGDSLMDSGTFGFKVTVQNSGPARPFQVFPEVVASSMGASAPCPFFNFALTTFLYNPLCNNFAVASGRINTRGDVNAVVDTSTPLNILNQISIGSGFVQASDVVIIDGGANDIADLVGSYFGATTPDGITSLTSKLSTVLPASTVASLVGSNPNPISLNAASTAYIQAVAQQLVQAINDKILARGVRKVVVVNAVDITTTPLFAGVMSAASAGPGSLQRAAAQLVVQGWTTAFNNALAAGLATSRVQIVDLNTQFTRFVTSSPTQYGLTNTSTPACPKVNGGLDKVGLPSLSQPATVLACNVANMSAHIPVGETSPNWWQNYAFADDFHPTPALHGLIGNAIVQQLQRVGWL